ncbi:hypothetical protein STEG23_015524, partial [Scotinomys teguina]
LSRISLFAYSQQIPNLDHIYKTILQKHQGLYWKKTQKLRVHFLRIPAHGLVLPTFKVNFPSLVNPLQKSLRDTPKDKEIKARERPFHRHQEY